MKTMKTMKTMKFLKPFYLLLIFSIIFSCSSDDSEADQELSISDLILTISDIEKTTATVEYSGNIIGETKKILYRERNSTGNYQTMVFQNSQLTLSNLIGATEYEVKFEVSNNTSNSQSDLYYFTTKSINFDYAKFYSDYSWYNSEYYSPYEFFSHLNRNHVIHAEGLSEFNDVKVYLVNEQKTDSLEIMTTVVSDSLSFTIPDNYLNQAPRESVKKAYISVKIKDSYQYILNPYTWINLSQNPDFTTDEPNLKLKIFNDKPFIESVNMSTGNSSNCPSYTNISFLGEFFGVWDFYYWTPERAELVIFDSNGSLYNSYTHIYGNSSFDCDNFVVTLPQSILNDGLLLYHQRNVAQVKVSNLPLGNYSAKIIFTYENISDSVETNTFNFTKE